jgi:hypothetical protein
MKNLTHNGKIVAQASSAKPRFGPASAGGVPPPEAKATPTSAGTAFSQLFICVHLCPSVVEIKK